MACVLGNVDRPAHNVVWMAGHLFVTGGEGSERGRERGREEGKKRRIRGEEEEEELEGGMNTYLGRKM